MTGPPGSVASSMSARAATSASAPEVWPDLIEIRDADGQLMRVATRAQALAIVNQRIGEAVGRGTVKYVRLLSITVPARETNDASRTVIGNLPATFKSQPPRGRMAVRPDRNVQNNASHADCCKHWLEDANAAGTRRTQNAL
jgi:hypothetical protein